MARDLIKPKKLKKGDTIAFIAPSSWCGGKYQLAKDQLEKHGYKVFVHPQCEFRDNSSAGTAEQKVIALHDVFANPEIDAVFCLRGGYRALHMLDKIDYDLIRNNPKIFLGYSDITALHGAIRTRANLVTFHGPVGNGFDDLAADAPPEKHKTATAALDFLSGNIPGNLFRDAPVRKINTGKAEGVLWGGNLQLVSALLESGNRYCPPFEKTILVIEDIDEEISKLDRQLGAWRLRGVFKNLAGLVIGGMTSIKDTPSESGAGAFVYTIEDIVRQHIGDLGLPVVIDAPIGHIHPNYVFAQGVPARLTANKNSALELLESPFAD